MDSVEVPLVAYARGERIVLGTAQVLPDGTVNAVVKEDLPPDLKRMFAWAEDVPLSCTAQYLERNGTVSPSRESRAAAEEWFNSLGRRRDGEK